MVGALATAELAKSLGPAATVGGVTWERRVVDPLPGPRPLDEVVGAERLNHAVALAGPQTRGPGGFLFAESRMAAALDEPTVLVDPSVGPRAVAAGLADACPKLGCDLVMLIDVGGDVLAHGDEAGLASPLCDAVMLAAAPALAVQGLAVGAGVFGAGCDGELTAAEVLERIAEVAAVGGLLGAWGLTPAAAARLAHPAAAIPTEASAQALHCFAGEVGQTAIRGGARSVALSPLGALTFYFDPGAAIATCARLAAAVTDAAHLAEANARLRELGIATELDAEQATGSEA